jgi:hypothetical protein
MQAYVRARHAICVVKNFPAVIPSERIDTTDRALLRFVVAFLAIANPKFGQMTWQMMFVQAFCKYVLFGTYRAASRGRTKFTMKPVRQHIITAYYDGLSPYSGISRTTFCCRCLALNGHFELLCVGVTALKHYFLAASAFTTMQRSVLASADLRIAV